MNTWGLTKAITLCFATVLLASTIANSSWYRHGLHSIDYGLGHDEKLWSVSCSVDKIWKADEFLVRFGVPEGQTVSLSLTCKDDGKTGFARDCQPSKEDCMTTKVPFDSVKVGDRYLCDLHFWLSLSSYWSGYGDHGGIRSYRNCRPPMHRSS